MADGLREPKCVIISAGSFIPMEIELEEGDYCIACDAGFQYAQNMGILPDLIVGDFDSISELSPDIANSISEIEADDPERVLRLEVRKDDTDTLKAVKIALSKGYNKIFLYGALGGTRIGHTIANIQTLLFIKHNGGRGYIMDADKMLLIAENETIRFHKGNKGFISIFSLCEESKGVTLKGLMYTMENGVIRNDFPVGVSNEFIIDEEAEITVEEGTLLVIASY